MEYRKPEDDEDQPLQKVEEPDLAGYYNASDYLEWTFEGFVELIKGKIVKMSSPASAHQVVSRQLLKVMIAHFDRQPCQLFHAPYDVYFVHEWEDFKQARNIVQPDICIICDRNKIKRLGCVGAPDLVVEILSPSSIRKDVGDKFSLYEQYGVKEYWIVNPVEGTITLNVLEDGTYRTLTPKAKGEILHSVLFPDLAVDLETVFDDIQFED
jgi:Uma2 family endonuclease